ncbi:fungal specific transcription factor [Trichoderma arundinaceum]|uniref:Fungal specific transcription factor n=1 Tax=Trichoderma arundinaceum TaxID=490622 RepID=A0A395NW82_TRIAR|nr:fungal specific transcription factor [Trichoderma arundinaceum]
MEERIEQVLAAITATTAGQAQAAPFVMTTLPSPFPMPDRSSNIDAEVHRILSRPYPIMPQLEGLSASDIPYLGMMEPENVVRDSYKRLPPLQEIQPIIDRYFTYVNPLMPLFSQITFIHMLHDYYASTRYDSQVWAAINIVLALGTRLPASPTMDIDLRSGDSKSAEYINNAQSVLSELVARDVDLLSLQVVLGLVIIFNGAKDQRPAVVLIGMAVRLAHRLRLHSRDHQHHVSLDEVIQRNRVFWIAYIFDKDICLRHHTPSVQADADIDLDLPTERPPDGAGDIYTKDSRFLVNFFQLRLRLAHIQGRVYDLLFSTRAAKIKPQERQARVALLHNQLEHWRLTVPPELQADVVTEHASRESFFWLCMMHFSHLGCLVMIHGMWSHDAEWRKRLTPIPFAIDATGTLDYPQPPPPLPRGWKSCVQMSRNCMSLMYRAPLSDCSVWTNGCAYFSALIILMANLFEYPTHEHVDADLQLTSYAVNLIDRMSGASTIIQMKRLNVVATELDRRAKLVIKHARGVATADGLLPLDREHLHEIGQVPLDGLQWDWGNDGVEAWPGMDVSLNETYSTMFLRNEAAKVHFAPLNGWTEAQTGGLFSAVPFDEPVGLF